MNALTIKNSLINNILGGNAQIPRKLAIHNQAVFLSTLPKALIDLIFFESNNSKTFPLVKK